MDFTPDEDHEAIRAGVQRVCAAFDDDYWRGCDDRHEFPWDFYRAMAAGGWIGIAIPSEHGGGFSSADLSAVEVALRLGEAWDARTVVVCAGPPAADAGLRDLLAAGADRALREDLYLPERGAQWDGNALTAPPPLSVEFVQPLRVVMS